MLNECQWVFILGSVRLLNRIIIIISKFIQWLFLWLLLWIFVWYKTQREIQHTTCTTHLLKNKHHAAVRLRSNGHCQVRVLEGGLVCHSEVDCFQIVSLLKEVSGMAQNPLIDWFCLCYFIRNGLAALLEGVFARKTNLNPGRLYDNDQRWWCNSILSQVPVPGTQGDSNKKQNCHQRSGSRDSDLSNVYFLYKSKFNLYRHVRMKFNELSRLSSFYCVAENGIQAGSQRERKGVALCYFQIICPMSCEIFSTSGIHKSPDLVFRNDWRFLVNRLKTPFNRVQEFIRRMAETHKTYGVATVSRID